MVRRRAAPLGNPRVFLPLRQGFREKSMGARARWLVMALAAAAVVVTGCQGIQFEDIEKAQTRHQLRGQEKRFELFNGTYRIGIPDVLNINVPDHPDLSGSFEVRPDGNISYPLLRDVYVEGLTPMQLSDRLAKELERYVRKVEVLVSVTGLYSKQVYVGARSTGRIRAIPFTGDMSVLDLLAANGGYTKQAYSSRIRLIRDDPDGTKVFRIRADKIMRGDLTTNVLVKENDFLYIPATLMAEIGYVFDTVTYPLRSVLSGTALATEAPYVGRYAEERAERGSATYRSY